MAAATRRDSSRWPLSYDQRGSRPIRVRLHDEGEPLSDDLLLALFLVLFWQQQSWDAYYQAKN